MTREQIYVHDLSEAKAAYRAALAEIEREELLAPAWVGTENHVAWRAGVMNGARMAYYRAHARAAARRANAATHDAETWTVAS